MKFLSHLRLGHRLAFGFGVVLVLLLAIAALALGGMRTLNQSLQDVAIRGGQQTAAVMEMERSANRFMATLRGIRGAELSEGEATMKLARAHWQDFQAARKAAGDLIPAGDASVQPMLAAVDAQARMVHELIPLGEKAAEGRGDTAAFFSMSLMLSSESEKWVKRHRDWSDALVAVSVWNTAAEQASVALAVAEATTQRNLVIAGCGLALLFGVFTAWRITQDVTQGFSATVEATERMARHDLSVPVDTHFKGELGVLAKALESMRLAQHDLASGVRQACDDIALASAEIAQGSQDLSGRAELAATNMQGAIGALSELDMSVDQASQSAQSANSLAADAQSAATRGDHVVGQAVATMNEIDAASRQIADITAIIDGIAFQTNILALNAAVEAARAGEQGRGFAVVAAEVRSLAQRSATAAREIRGLIEATLEKVVTGSEHVKRAGSATSEIMVSVQRVSSTIESIAAEGAQQRHGIGQAKSSVNDLDRGAQQDAALAEESAAAASSLRDQADRLKGLVERFKLRSA
ncbi:methyl-accepting chemotaxis protein [Hydrogenophaga sp. PAMC20947]|uniref:methyl-accepting chemotaxis protein n=1 Tax=Hydrogenophaga sp. PAMC20947 TaxID=2565558 RepID=UPI001447C2D9|nr:methyl-accepting chemotaxis protein [Hydrogenophaga sp. PAMC20947]